MSYYVTLKFPCGRTEVQDWLTTPLDKEIEREFGCGGAKTCKEIWRGPGGIWSGWCEGNVVDVRKARPMRRGRST